MKKIFLLSFLSAFFVVFSFGKLSAQVNIGADEAPKSFSALEIQGQYKTGVFGGLRLPQLTLSERNSITGLTSPDAIGLMILNTDNNCVEYWNGTKWVSLCSGDDDTGPGGDPDPGEVCDDPSIVNPDAIAGLTFLCLQTTATYSVTQAPGMSYYWSLPNGWSITSSSGAKSTIEVSIAPNTKAESQQLQISVRACSADNCCGEAKTLIVKQAASFPGGCSVCSSITPTGWLTFLGYNLGANSDMTMEAQMAYSPTGATDATVYGDLYQWGRTTDGHQQRFPTPAMVAGPLSGSTNLNNNTGQPAGTNIGKFITSGTSDWRTPQDDLLWYNGGKTVNDPCPAGYRIPTQTEWGSIYDSAYSNPSTATLFNTWTWKSAGGGTAGYVLTPVGSSTATLFLPAAGYRDHSSGALTNVGTIGDYWSSSNSSISTNAFHLGIGSGGVNPALGGLRAHGQSIRCIAEY